MTNTTVPMWVNVNLLPRLRVLYKEIVKFYLTGCDVTWCVKTLKGCFGSRHVFALLSFFGLASVFMCRVNLSVAIVHMVRHYTIASFANTSALPVTDHCPLSNEEEEIVEVLHHGEFDWDSRTQGLVLGAFYWGYIVPQIPAGILSERYGGKHVFGSGLLLAGIFTLLTPVAARFNIGALIAMRVLVGLSEVNN